MPLSNDQYKAKILAHLRRFGAMDEQRIIRAIGGNLSGEGTKEAKILVGKLLAELEAEGAIVIWKDKHALPSAPRRIKLLEVSCEKTIAH